MRDKILLRQLQALPLTAKITLAEQRIVEWYEHYEGKVCISFSGGKDSTVLVDLVHGIYPEVPLVFSNTGLEYPEIQSFARKMGAEFVRPKMSFSDVISKYGYPIISKEVAEAIRYSRKVRHEIKGNDHSRTVCRREMMTGEFGLPDWKLEKTARMTHRMEMLGKYAGSVPETYEAGERQVAGLEDGKTNSMYNKTKWLPLCNETQFKIGEECCDVMKKKPLDTYQKKSGLYPYLGTMAEESRIRATGWVKHGCNAFDSGKPKSAPLSVWTDQDVLHYIKKRNLEICSVYGEILAVDNQGFYYEPMPGTDCKLKCTGCRRTGCIFCGFGAQHDPEPRFVRLAKTHPKQYEYCMRGGQWVDNPDYDPAAPEYDGEWKNWNPKKIWVPSKEGLGMKKVFDDCNQIYGKDFIKYE